MVGAAPLVAFTFIMLPFPAIIQGAETDFQSTCVPLPGFIQIKSVPVIFNPTPVQVVQGDGVAVPEASKEAVVPAGGRNSSKLMPMPLPPETPVSVTVIFCVVPALPVRLYQASRFPP